MREILFRGKSVEHGEWVEGSLIIEEPPLQCFPAKCPQIGKYLIGKSSAADWNMPRPFITTEVVPETVCQFTGLTDKNGVKVFNRELRIKNNMKGELKDEYISDVEFIDGCFCFSSKSNDYIPLSFLFKDERSSCPSFEFEVLGNIYLKHLVNVESSTYLDTIKNNG